MVGTRAKAWGGDMAHDNFTVPAWSRGTIKEDWPYSSFSDYCGLRSETLCNIELAIRLLDLNMESFYQDSYRMIGIEEIENIF